MINMDLAVSCGSFQQAHKVPISNLTTIYKVLNIQGNMHLSDIGR